MSKNIEISVLLLLALVFTIFVSFTSLKSETNSKEFFKPVIVLELFTSQGCSSCPPADQLLNEVKQKFPEKVFALSYHVDYWNYIGWKDPFSRPEFSTKQRFYNSKFKSQGNYTPQLVVNGREHFVGSNHTKVYKAITRTKNLTSTNQIEISNIKDNGTKVNFDYKIDGHNSDLNIRAVLVLDERTTRVTRGENSSRTLKNSNIVVAEKYLGKTAGKGFINIPALV